MASDNNNPFILPGLGQTGDMAQNPILASMEMMRQAWQGLAGAGGIGGSPMAMPTSPEELDRRIKDLRAVENWLRMNLTMLTSTIQGLEVQSATLSTLQSFMSTATGAAHTPTMSTNGPSPLEVALGIRRPGQNPSSNQEPPAATPPVASQPAAAEAATNSADASQPGTDSPYAAQAASAAQGWWDMLQTQFDTLAAATAATLEGAQAASQEAQAQAQAMAAPSKATKSPATKRSTSTRKTATKGGTKSTGKTAPKPVAKKATKAAATSTSKTSAKTSSVASGAPQRSTAKKTGTARGRSSKT
ncbi:PhaM family polyhydroxyalkanoate granule multifunctional regulatory protein [Pusillimonas sp. ANT_WB101]|uniref:PhaM family polyhydroxyalkanoate granule multifunctional regulatory protein n=1 Tax=Pusillimonas sp. ANT_WB101 TaxID=2597356 RepID=UPI00165E5945|nr:PhaM family polyhydroxyalkanoate granule multifunctional regulatory protein [Pusillimonas sp. ANT_WB101]